MKRKKTVNWKSRRLAGLKQALRASAATFAAKSSKPRFEMRRSQEKELAGRLAKEEAEAKPLCSVDSD